MLRFGQHLDKKSHYGKLGARKQVLIHLLSQVMGMASRPCGQLRLGLYKKWYLQKKDLGTLTSEKTKVKKDQKVASGIHVVVIST